MTNQEIGRKILSQPVDPDWTTQIKFRFITKQDLPALEWEGEYIRFRRVYKDVFRRTKSGFALMWGIDLPHVGLIGQVFVQLDTRTKELADGVSRGYVHSFRVKTPYRGFGLGSRLMNVVEQDLVKRGYGEVTLNVAQENQGALRLYQRLGYKIIKQDPGRWNYYDEKNILREVIEPGYRMLKKL